MKYKREIYQKVNRKLENSRKKAELKSEKLKKTVFEKIPRLAQIERILAANSMKLVKSVFAFKKSFEGEERLKNYTEFASKIKFENDALHSEFCKILEENGFNPEDLKPKYACEKCCDTGVFNGRECECKKRLLLREATVELNKLSAFKLSTFESFSIEYYSERPNCNGKIPREIMARIFRNCREYAKNFEKKSNSMLFFGETGLGKTHLSLAIAHEVINKGFNAVYATAQEIVRKCEMKRFHTNGDSIDETDCYSECDLLIIDDLGAEFITNFSKSAIYEIVNNRILRQKKTVISTNLTISKITDIYSKRFISRLLGHYYRIEFCGDDIRTKVVAIS